MNNTYTNPDDWYKDHWQDLKDYVGEYVAFSKDGVIDHDVDYLTMIDRIQLDSKDYIIDRIFENEFVEPAKFYGLRFRTIKASNWQPKGD